MSLLLANHEFRLFSYYSTTFKQKNDFQITKRFKVEKKNHPKIQIQCGFNMPASIRISPIDGSDARISIYETNETHEKQSLQIFRRIFQFSFIFTALNNNLDKEQCRCCSINTV